MFDLEKANQNIEALIDLIEEQRALLLQYPTFNPDVDLEEMI